MKKEFTAHQRRVLVLMREAGATPEGNFISREFLAMRVWPDVANRAASKGGPTGLGRALGPTLAVFERAKLIDREWRPASVRLTFEGVRESNR